MVPYGPAAKSASRPETLEMATIDPLLLASRCGNAACARRTVCMRSTSNEVYQFSSVSGIARALMFATTASRPPIRSAAAPTQPVRAAPSRTSSCTPVAAPPSAFSVASISAASRAQNSTTAPSSPNASPSPRPIPRVPPVTSTREPFSCRSMAGSPSGSVKGRRAAAQLVVQSAIGRRRRQQGLAGREDGAVVRVHDVRERSLRHLREQLVGIHRVQAVELAEPAHELHLADPPGVLERPAGPHGHPAAVVLEPRPGRRATLDQLHDERRGHGALDRRPAGLTLALPVVAVAHGEQGALDVDAQEAGRAGPHLRGVHVSAA